MSNIVISGSSLAATSSPTPAVTPAATNDTFSHSLNYHSVYFNPSSTSSSTSGCSSSGTTLTGTDNIQKAYNYYTGKGLTGIQAAAILGNFYQESGVNPNKSQDNGAPGRGIAQWSVDGRWLGALALAQSTNRSVFDLGLQLDFSWQEMQTAPYNKALSDLKLNTDIATATKQFEIDYEGAGTPDIDFRISDANDIYTKYGGSTASSQCTQASVTCNSTGQGGGSVAGLSTLRQNVVCLANNELALWTAGTLKPCLGEIGHCDFEKYSQGRDELWCADFIGWIYKQAGYPIQTGTDFSLPYVPDDLALAKQDQRFHFHPADGSYTPRPGDIVFFNGTDHVAIITSVNGNNVIDVGGDEGGNQGGVSPYWVTSQVQTENIYYAGASFPPTGFMTPDN